jgi:hypothetical protein
MSKPRSVCDVVAERVATGEPIGEDAHVAGCERCTRTVELAHQLVATHAAVEVGLGFSARMTVGAQRQLVVRKRRRVAAGLSAAVAMCALGAVLVTHAPSGSDAPVASTPAPITDKHDDKADHDKAAAKDPEKDDHRDDQLEPDPWNPPEPGEVDDDVAALVHLSDLDTTTHLGASWSRIERPLAPYRSLIRGVQP